MPKVSVIIPVYNSEMYLEQCLDSLASQTLQDLEFIIIDDGSTDSGPQICDKYAQMDDRFVVIHKENAGMGVSYNLGIDKARGEYIGFLESDDFAQQNMFEDLYNLAKKHDTNIVKSTWFRFFSKKAYAEKDFQFAGFNSWQILNIKDHPDLLQRQCSVWSAIYRTQFLRDKNIRYLETPGASYQDVSFTYKAFCQADNMVVTPNAYVHYRQDNENSSVNSKEKAEVIFWEYEEVDRFFAEHPEIKCWANTDKLIKQYYDYRWNYNRIADKFKPDFIQHFANDFKKYLEQKELNKNFFASIDKNEFNKIIGKKFMIFF